MNPIKTMAIVSITALLITPQSPYAKTPRSSAAKAEFKRATLCPSTGAPKGACPGYIIDHVIPLACGGPDTPANMQWQTVTEAKAKDKWERRGCSR